MIINTNFFITADIAIPLVGSNTPIETGNQNDLQWYIDVYEREVLIKGLGRQLYELFIAEIQQDQNDANYGNLIPGASQRFTDLLDGLTYMDGDENRYWNGLRFTIATSNQTALRSLVAYYIYYRYVNDRVSNLTNLGVVSEMAKNANLTDPTPKMSEAWRNFFRMYQGEYHYNDSPYGNRYYYNGFYVQDYSAYNRTGEVSLWRFLQDNSDIYPEWEFTPCEDVNQFNI